jgi:hypothetical protein
LSGLFFDEINKTNSGSVFSNGYDLNICSIYTEADIFFLKLAARIRAANNDLLNETAISPVLHLYIKLPKRFFTAYILHKRQTWIMLSFK